MKYEVPIWEKANLTFEEAAAYFGIGINRLRDLTSNDYCPYVLWIGSKRLIKRRAFERYLETAFSVCFYILRWKMGSGYDKITPSIQALSTAERSLTMSAKRKDKKGRVLRTGESQHKDLTYQYRCTAPSGKRHTANAGMAIKDLQYLMGHSDADVTWNVYTHASYAHAEDITVPDKWKGAKAWLRLHQIYTNWP